MTDYTISPAYEIINYAWSKLKSAGVLDESDYYSESLNQTVMPFLPVQEQPEFNLDLGQNTFFVYEYIVKPTDADFWRKSGQVIMYAYDNDFNKLAEIAFNVSLTASATASSDASGSAIKFVNRVRILSFASRVARPIICIISVRLERYPTVKACSHQIQSKPSFAIPRAIIIST